MPRERIQPIALTVGQLARRWAVSVDRVNRLIRHGLLHAFRIPAAGRYGETTKIPLSEVIQAERDWAITPSPTDAQRRRKPPLIQGGPVLKHFPELLTELERDAELPEASPRLSERISEASE